MTLERHGEDLGALDAQVDAASLSMFEMVACGMPVRSASWFWLKS